MTARVVSIAAIGAALEARMYALFADYYDEACPERFGRDLRDKSFAVLIEGGGALVGFTTAKLFDFNWRGETIGVLFSGDTIVERRFWGEQALARAWLGEVGRIARRSEGRRLFWFLIVKGHRTFRYLPAFARSYVPAPHGDAPEELLAVRDAVARAWFGDAYDAARGIIRFDAPRDHLRSQWGYPTPRERKLAEVAYFLDANPGYLEGDELACLCALSRENMRSRAQRWFDAGFDDA